MDQTRALNALAPFIALAKSATSPRAAADLITQATSAPNTFVFAELLQQPNIQALAGHNEFGLHYELLQCFAWGTWEDSKRFDAIKLSDAQTLKLRLLSLMTIASEKQQTNSTQSNLSYASLSSRLGLTSAIDLEHLVTQAIYSNLITATLNPANQTVVITSVAPLRDLAPGSLGPMIAELEEWSKRCTDVLKDLEDEVARVKADSARRHAQEAKAEKQVRAVVDAGDKGSGLGAYSLKGSGSGRKILNDDDDDDDDAMDLDAGGPGPVGGFPGRKRGGGGGAGVGGLLGKMKSRGGGR